MKESLPMGGPMSVTVAYDPANGHLLRVHFSHAAMGMEEAAKAAAWLQKAAPPEAKVLHLAPGSMAPGKSYRVDVASGALVEDAAGGGLSASSGTSLVPPSTSNPLP